MTAILQFSKNSEIIERPNGVNRQPSNGQKFKRQPTEKGKFYRQPSKREVVISRKRFLRSFKPQYFSCSSRTAGSQRIVLKLVQLVSMFPNILTLRYFLLIFSKLTLQQTSIGYKVVMINHIDKNDKVNINSVKSWKITVNRQKL